jgi:fibronectin-binding autotransporter adhesin
MKLTASLRALLIASSALFAASFTQAAILYWDGTDTTANADGGNGSWDISSNNWDNAPIAGANVIWNNATPDFAVFPGVQDTVTLGVPIVVGGLRFDSSGYTIDASTHSLTFGAANNSILLAGNSNATITGTVGGSGNVAIGPLPSLGRTLTLNGTSTGGWTGSTTVHLGSTLALAGSSQALLQTSGITLNGGGVTLTNAADTTDLNRVSNSAAITANGGVFTYANPSDANTYTETIGAVALMLGQTGFSLSANQAGGGSQTLTLSGLTRTGAANTSAVAFSAAGTSPNATTNQIVVSGGLETPAGQIIGPWATTGTSAVVQTNYAVFDNSARVLPANIAASTQDSWTNPSHAYTSSGAAVTLTGNRSMSALRNTGATATITLSDGTTGYNLATNGILNAVNSQLTITPGPEAPGAITAPGTDGGHIYINTGGSRAFGLTTNNNTILSNLSIDISAPINDNGGPVTLVKTGDNSVLRLTGTKNYSGGTVVNAGILFVDGDAALGATSGKITLNGGQLRSAANGVTFNRITEIGPAGGSFAGIGNQTNINFNGKLTGSGTFFMVDTGGAGGRVAFFNSTENDFTGAILIPTAAVTVRFNSLLDTSGAGDIILYRGAAANGAAFHYGAGAEFPLTLNHRSIQIINNSADTMGNITLSNLNTTHPITINTDLVSIGSRPRTFVLDAAAGPINTFAGKLTDGTGGGVLNLTKSGAGTWVFSGNNNYSGATTVGAGTLLINGNQSAATGAVAVNASSTLGGSGIIGGTVTVAAGARLAPGNTAVGTLAIGGGLDISAMAAGAGTLNYDLGPIASSDKITVGGGLNIGSGELGFSDFVFSNAGGLQAGTYTLITSSALTGTLKGADLVGTIGSFDATLQISGNNIVLALVAGKPTTTLVIDLGTGTQIPGGAFGTFGALNLPIPPLPVGSILRSLEVNAVLAATDNANFASDLAILFDPTPETPGGDFSVVMTNGAIDFGAPVKLGWPAAANLGPPTPLVSTKVAADWAAAGTIDLATTGIFLGNAYNDDLSAPNEGGTWSGTITLTYDMESTGSPYANWAGSGVDFDGDENGDGVSNGMAFLLGATSPNANALALLPTVTETGGGLVLTFSMLNAANRGDATLSVEHSGDLGLGDAWTTVLVPETSGGPTSGVSFSVTANGNLNSVVATIAPGEAAGGKLFGRLKAENP